MAADARRRGLNAPSGAQCFPTLTWLERLPLVGVGLNAPSGAQYFPTLCSGSAPAPKISCLNAPSGAQYFPTADGGDHFLFRHTVSMHLLVLSAFRRKSQFAKFEIEQVSIHLLVLSAFRPANRKTFATTTSKVSMHLLVLSAFRPVIDGLDALDCGSQCTFWCSVLSDTSKQVCGLWPFATGLNAPSGAQYFPTWSATDHRILLAIVSMHLLVLSAFRLEQCLFARTVFLCLNAPSGAQCFPTAALSAKAEYVDCLNAPSGAQCFPTRRRIRAWLMWMSLNAPSGAQCFPTETPGQVWALIREVSMHLLVLSAFRQPLYARVHSHALSQCTFWCSVLSDAYEYLNNHNPV